MSHSRVGMGRSWEWEGTVNRPIRRHLTGLRRFQYRGTLVRSRTCPRLSPRHTSGGSGISTPRESVPGLETVRFLRCTFTEQGLLSLGLQFRPWTRSDMGRPRVPSSSHPLAGTRTGRRTVVSVSGLTGSRGSRGIGTFRERSELPRGIGTEVREALLVERVVETVNTPGPAHGRVRPSTVVERLGAGPF